MCIGKDSFSESEVHLIPKTIADVTSATATLHEVLRDRQDECLVVLHLSAQLEHLQFTCHKGRKDHVFVPTRKIVADILELGTKGLILAHNHPSGDGTPSSADLAITKRFVELCDEFDVSLLDHLIFAGGRWTSLRDEGYF